MPYNPQSTSSGESGGYYRFRCKNFFTHNCGNWVWVNNSACAECCVNKPISI
ncbi:hypothetical protein BDD12DRAFT_737315 [Trichophaea hybrida]|nr:hypothetical protein BDD12DRAFT_737315 [Trichophaea hybrida]